jgi:UrcA family protein
MENLTAKHAMGMVLLCASCLTTTAAIADEPARSVTLRYTRADLHGPHAAGLYNKIRSAARLVCAPQDSWELARRRVYQQCVDTAVARAVAQIDAEELTSIHLAHGGQPPPWM